MATWHVCRDCTVAGVERFGIFVEFLAGRQGLVHTSEFALGEGLDDFKVNDKVDVTLAGVCHLKIATLPLGSYQLLFQIHQCLP